MSEWISVVESINDKVNGFIWGPVMLVFLMGTGIYFTVGTKFLQLNKFNYIMKNTIMKVFKNEERIGEGDISPFQALTTALAATVGTGNIAGVATAIVLGGPGAIFWMWVSAFFGMMTKFAEVVLAVHYREKNAAGNWVGGPMYYITNGLKLKWLGVVFSIFGALAAFGIGNLVQANSVAAALESTFKVPPIITGILLAICAGLVIIGGITRIAKFTEKLVPIMAALYILGATIVLILNITAIPEAIVLIVKSAFTVQSAVGGFVGATMMKAMRYGVARGVFSNEAGLGSAPIAHAAAQTDHPVQQGLWGVFEVFADTIVICSLTALVILTSGLWTSGVSGAALTTDAFNATLPGIGGIIVAVGILLFAFSTMISWSYYGEKCTEYLFGTKFNKTYRIIFIPLIIVGAVGQLDVIWNIADTLNGLMAIPNLIGLVGLSGVVFKLTKNYFNSYSK